MSGSAPESVSLSGLSATPSPFRLKGGRYGVVVTGSDWQGGSVALRQVGRPVVCEFRANGYGVLDLPAGEYELAIVGASSGYATISRVSDRP